MTLSLRPGLWKVSFTLMPCALLNPTLEYAISSFALETHFWSSGFLIKGVEMALRPHNNKTELWVVNCKWV